MNGSGYKFLLVMVALVTLFGGAVAYDTRRDNRLEWAIGQQEKRLDRMETKIDRLLEMKLDR